MTIHVAGEHPGALRLAARTIADAVRPRPPVPFREWLPQNIILVDGPKKGEFWSLEDALIDIRKLTQDIQIRLERIENQNARDSK